jgi:hypothetical protein
MLKRFVAVVAALDRLAYLVIGEFEFRPHFHALRLGAFRPSPVRARINSRSNSASPPSTVNIRRPCAVVVSAHVSPRDLNPAFFAAIAATVLRRSRVDRASRSGVHIAFVERRQCAAQSGAVGPCAACCFTKDFLGSGLAQLLHLRVNALAVCRYPCITVNHGSIMHVIYAQKKRL